MRLNNIQKRYGEKVVLDGVSLELREGEITCILGRSGAGKTTLLNILAGLLPYEGEIFPMPKKVGYVFQESRLLPYLTVRENLLYAGGKPEWIDETLQKAGLAALADRKAGSLSGGEKRRVALLRAFCVDADLVLLDEPFSALDTVSKAQMLGLAWDFIRSGGLAAVFVTHDLDEAISIADTVLVLDEGKIVHTMRLPAAKEPREYGKYAKERQQLLDVMKNTKELGRI
ncbi:MAG: ATP-binding cassette domain-containing protein [Clostridia bacterium]|nr:ATP-binding cassette domain-containing protein [Clostridia bacterium]